MSTITTSQLSLRSAVVCRICIHVVQYLKVFTLLWMECVVFIAVRCHTKLLDDNWVIISLCHAAGPGSVSRFALFIYCFYCDSSDWDPLGVCQM